MAIKNIIFDFDGTLVDSSYAVEQLFNHFKQKYVKKEIGKTQLHALRQMSLLQKLKKTGIPLYRVPSILVEAKKLYADYMYKVKLVDGILQILEKLDRQGFELSILSSNSVQNISSFLNHKCINLFSGIYSAKNIFEKNKAIIKILKQKKLTREDVVYVGDELNDIIACKKIPVKVLAVTWGLDSLDALKTGKPDGICRSIEDIYDYVISYNQQCA